MKNPNDKKKKGLKTSSNADLVKSGKNIDLTRFAKRELTKLAADNDKDLQNFIQDHLEDMAVKYYERNKN